MLRGLPGEVAVVSGIAFCVALGFGIAAPALPLYAREFGVSALAASAVVSVFALMRLLASAPAGWAVGRWGERPILTSGLIIVAVSTAAAALAQTYPQLLLTRSLGGIGSSMFTVAAMALLLRVAAPQQRGRAAAAFQAGFLAGGVAGPAVGGAVIGISLRAPFVVYAATLTLASVVAFRYLPRGNARTTTAADGQPPVGPDAAIAQESAGVDGSPMALRDALRTRAYRAALGANLTNGFVTFGLRFALVPLFVVEGLGQPTSWSGIAFLVAAAAQAVALVPAGRMTDLRGRRPALLLGTTATALGMLLLALTAQVWVFLVAILVLGASAALMGSAPAAVVGDVNGRAGGGTVIAVFQMTSDAGAIVGPLLAGLLLDSLGFGWAFATGAAVAGLAALLALAMPETLQRDTSQH